MTGAGDTSALQSMIYVAKFNGAPAMILAMPNGCSVTASLEICSDTAVIQRGLLRAKSDWSASSGAFGMYAIADGATDVRIASGDACSAARTYGRPVRP